MRGLEYRRGIKGEAQDFEYLFGLNLLDGSGTAGAWVCHKNGILYASKGK